jgi:hypothetical protein
MNSEPRVWKWMVPAMFMVSMLPLGAFVNAIAERNSWAWLLWCNWFVYGMMPVLFVQAWQANRAYFRHLAVEDFIDKRNAVTTTAETRLFDYAHTMHPDTVKMLLMHRKSKWRVKETKLTDLVDWVLDADPRIHVGLVEYVLEHSTQYAMMPMNNHFSDKAFSFDPERLVTDYDQYRAFHRLLVNRLMATEALGNQPGQWIEPWNPELVGRNFGVLLEDEAVPEMIEDIGRETKPKDIGRETKPKDIGQETNVKPNVKHSQPQAVVSEPTDQELEAVRLENENYARKFGSDVKSYLEFKNKNKKEK